MRISLAAEPLPNPWEKPRKLISNDFKKATKKLIDFNFIIQIFLLRRERI